MGFLLQDTHSFPLHFAKRLTIRSISEPHACEMVREACQDCQEFSCVLDACSDVQRGMRPYFAFPQAGVPSLAALPRVQRGQFLPPHRACELNLDYRCWKKKS